MSGNLGTISGTPGRMNIFRDNPAGSGTVGNYGSSLRRRSQGPLLRSERFADARQRAAITLGQVLTRDRPSRDHGRGSDARRREPSVYTYKRLKKIKRKTYFARKRRVCIASNR